MSKNIELLLNPYRQIEAWYLYHLYSLEYGEQCLAALQAVADKLGSRPYGTGSYLPKSLRDQVFAAIDQATKVEGGSA